MPVRSPLRRGFTLIEVMTAVVILIILASLAVTYMMYGMGRARMNNAVFDVAAMVSSAQLRAVSRGTPHYVFIHQTADENRVRLLVLERPDEPTPGGPALPNWAALDLSVSPEKALEYVHTKPDGTTEIRDAMNRDQLVLGIGTGLDSNGLSFLDLDSPRVTKPLPAPFSNLPLTTPSVTASPLDKPSQNLMVGCNFCVSPSGHPYGVLRFNPDGTMQVMTGLNVDTGAVIAFAPNTESEKQFLPKLLAVSAPAGATIVF